jgi:hypothetical protein
VCVDLSTLANVVTNLVSLSKDRDVTRSSNSRSRDPAARAFDTMARVVQGHSLRQLVRDCC